MFLASPASPVMVLVALLVISSSSDVHAAAPAEKELSAGKLRQIGEEFFVKKEINKALSSYDKAIKLEVRS